MTEESDSDDEQQENRRVLLQRFFDRLNHLAGLISNTDGFVFVILIGIVVGILHPMISKD